MPPTVSIIVPCYNEQGTIGTLLDAILGQTYPRKQIEVVIADGLSQDKTREVIAQFGQAHPGLSLRVVDNARRTIPSGLNLAIAAARGEILIRLDAHSMPIPEYVERCVEDIETGKGSSVGGVWEIRPGGTGWIPRGIAAAASHPLGAGDALYRVGARAGPVDTVPFGAFRRSLLMKVNGFDETLLTNEDYELNARIRREGGVIWLDPEIRSKYFARATLAQLASQYWRYGYWKFRMLRRYPSTLRWRQALPPIFVGGLLGTALCALLWSPALIVLGIEIALYVVALVAAGIDIGVQGRAPGLIPGSMLALMTMHFGWGSGFLWSLVSGRNEPHG